MLQYRPLAVETRAQGTTTILSCHGEIDIESIAKLSWAFTEALDDSPETLVLDLSDVDFLDIRGARFISNAIARTRATTVRLVVLCDGAVSRTLNLAGVDYNTDNAPRTSLERAMDSYILETRKDRRAAPTRTRHSIQARTDAQLASEG